MQAWEEKYYERQEGLKEGLKRGLERGLKKGLKEGLSNVTAICNVAEEFARLMTVNSFMGISAKRIINKNQGKGTDGLGHKF